ncbi:MAG: hypothetical protein R2710_15445 [Acidimicrobiales bacterium]
MHVRPASSRRWCVGRQGDDEEQGRIRRCQDVAGVVRRIVDEEAIGGEEGARQEGPVKKRHRPRRPPPQAPRRRPQARRQQLRRPQQQRRLPKTATKKTATKKTATKKTATKKAPAKKNVSKKPAATKPSGAKKTATKKVAASAAAGTKAPAKSAAKRTAATSARTDAAGPSADRTTTKASRKTSVTAKQEKHDKPKYLSDKKWLAARREELIAERKRYTHSAEALAAEAAALMADREPGDVQFDEESGEGDTLAVERDRDLALSAQAREKVDEIDAALDRLDRGTYGQCIVGGPGDYIPEERLEALPMAPKCIAHQTSMF